MTWHRIDSSTSGNSPTRFPSGIYVDPSDPGHAWISYSGYNAATPLTKGHVFEVKENGTSPGSGIFTNLNVEAGTAAYPTPDNDGDLPVSDVVRDDAYKTLYVSTDFGVLRGDNDGKGGWHVTAGMPRYEVRHLEIQPSSRADLQQPIVQPPALRGDALEGIWKMKIGNAPGDSAGKRAAGERPSFFASTVQVGDVRAPGIQWRSCVSQSTSVFRRSFPERRGGLSCSKRCASRRSLPERRSALRWSSSGT